MILLLEKAVAALTGPEPQHVVTISVSFGDYTTVPYHEVQILPDGASIKIKMAGRPS